MPIEIVYDIEDASGDHATTSVKVGDSTSATLLAGFATGFATALNNLIGGIIRSAAAFLRVDPSSLTGNIVGVNSDVEHIGKFEFLTETGFRCKVNIPSLAEVTIGTTTSDVMNQAETNVAAFIAAMEDGVSVTGALIQPCDVGEGDITDVVFAREAFKNSGARSR